MQLFCGQNRLKDGGIQQFVVGKIKCKHLLYRLINFRGMAKPGDYCNSGTSEVSVTEICVRHTSIREYLRNFNNETWPFLHFQRDKS